MPITKNQLKSPFLFAIVLSFLCCTTTKQGYISSSDKKFVETPPAILNLHNKYFLVFQYGLNANWYHPESRIEASKLLFFVSVMTSTGSTRGLWHMEEIIDPEKLRLVKSGKAFWEDTPGSLKPLKIHNAN